MLLLVAFFANLGREIIKDCEDMESDEGRNTLPMRIGLMNARSVAYVFIAGIYGNSWPCTLHRSSRIPSNRIPCPCNIHSFFTERAFIPW